MAKPITELIALFIVTTFVTYRGNAYDFDRSSIFGSGDADYGFVHGDRRSCLEDEDCYFTPEPYCCVGFDGANVCCKDAHRRAADVTYGEGLGIRCNSQYGEFYWCPPWHDSSQKYCCYQGNGCCTVDAFPKIPSSYPDKEKNPINQNGVSSMGAIAGFVFLAVILAGTLLTLATRYIKVKVRREQRGAGIHSQAYIDAMNRRSNRHGAHGQNSNAGNNNDSSTQQAPPNAAPQVFYIQTIPEEEEDEDEEAGAGPPPSYDEAMATCPVAVEEDARTENRRQETGRRNFLFRPPTRPSRMASDDFESIPLSIRKDNYDPIDEYHRNIHNSAASNVDAAITLPKQDDSDA